MNKAVLIVLALAAAVACGWYFLWPSEEARVRKSFKEVAAALEKDGSEANMDSVRKARHAAAFVEPGCTFELAIGEDTQKFTLSKVAADITQQVVVYRMNVSRIHMSFEDLKVALTDKNTAEAACDFFYEGEGFGWGGRDARTLEATLRKDPESGRWRFARVRLSNIIEK